VIEAIQLALKKNGHNVEMIEADENAYIKLKNLKDQGKIDIVFNYSEGFYGESREA
jgi:hypothetical protein